MSYDSRSMNLGDIWYCAISPERCIETYLWIDLIFNWINRLIAFGFHSQSLKILWQLLTYSKQLFLYLHVTDPLLYMVNLVFVSSPRWIFISSLIGSLDASLIEKLILQSLTKYLIQNLVFIWNSALREKFNFYFSAVFASIDKIFILGGKIGTRLYNFIKFWEFPDIS